jgi:signal peptidase I
MKGPQAAKTPSPGSAEPARQQKSVVREYAEALLVALALALFIRTFLVQAFKIPSGSMLPTLQIGDHLLANKLLYGLRVPIYGTRYLSYFEPEREDIVVFVYPEDREKDFIKRVVGIPGDRIEIRHKKLYRNGEPVDEPYARYTDPEGPAPRDNFGPVTVPAGHVFVMGDNRDHSFDSRFWGFVPYEDIKGKAFVIYWSWDGEDSWVRWDRLGSLVH